MNKVLVIAGLDPLGYSGLLRDTSMIHHLGFQSAAIVTALTSQTKTKFYKAQPANSTQLKNQLRATLPFSQYKAIKLGMLGNEKIVTTLAKTLKKNKYPFLVADPVFKSSSGGTLLTPKGISIFLKKLLPLCHIWTPNLHEASLILKRPVTSSEHMYAALFELYNTYHVPLLLKGGHLKSKIIDLYYDGKEIIEFRHKRVDKKTRGTGCALASLIAGFYAQKRNIKKAVIAAEQKLQEIIRYD
ncbi:hydroxymethylpyrimidine/phosphomethylpyrimidine kinase [bacterium]|nr:hydroxymethylpyrimidine/phosphomethylpyrimidine kinase [bacterium]